MVVKKGAGNFHKEGEFLYSARVPCSIGRIYLHQNNKLFGARKEKFMGCFILAEIHWEKGRLMGWRLVKFGGIKRHFPWSWLSVLATQEFSHRYKHESFRCCKYLFYFFSLFCPCLYRCIIQIVIWLKWWTPFSSASLVLSVL